MIFCSELFLSFYFGQKISKFMLSRLFLQGKNLIYVQHLFVCLLNIRFQIVLSCESSGEWRSKILFSVEDVLKVCSSSAEIKMNVPAEHWQPWRGDSEVISQMQNTGRPCNPLILSWPPGPGRVSPRSPVWILQWGCSEQWHVRYTWDTQPNMEAEAAAAVERWEQFPVVSGGEDGVTILIVSTPAIPPTLAQSHTLPSAQWIHIHKLD